MTSSPHVGHRRRRDTPDARHVPQSRPISNSNTEASAILTSSYYTCCRFPSSLLLSLLQLPGTRVMYRIIQLYLFYLVLTFATLSWLPLGRCHTTGGGRKSTRENKQKPDFRLHLKPTKTARAPSTESFTSSIHTISKRRAPATNASNSRHHQVQRSFDRDPEYQHTRILQPRT